MKCVLVSDIEYIGRWPFILSDHVVHRIMAEIDRADPERQHLHTQQDLREVVSALLYCALTGQLHDSTVDDGASTFLVRHVYKRWRDRGILKDVSTVLGIDLADLWPDSF